MKYYFLSAILQTYRCVYNWKSCFVGSTKKHFFFFIKYFLFSLYFVWHDKSIDILHVNQWWSKNKWITKQIRDIQIFGSFVCFNRKSIFANFLMYITVCSYVKELHILVVIVSIVSNIIRSHVSLSSIYSLIFANIDGF